MVFGGEGDLDFKFIANTVTDDLILKSGNKGVGAQLQILLFGLSAFKGNAVGKAFVIDIGRIPVLCGTVGDFDLSALTGTDILQLLFHFLFGYLHGFL